MGEGKSSNWPPPLNDDVGRAQRPRGRGLKTNVVNGPLPWGEGGERSEPGEGFLLIEACNFVIRVESIAD